jgi:hypothetical protein
MTQNSKRRHFVNDELCRGMHITSSHQIVSVKIQSVTITIKPAGKNFSHDRHVVTTQSKKERYMFTESILSHIISDPELSSVSAVPTSYIRASVMLLLMAVGRWITSNSK